MNRSMIAGLAAALALCACRPAMPETPTRPPTTAPTTSAQPDAQGCTRVVAPGDDLQGAADSARPGDVVCFSPGVYATEGMRLTASGAEGRPIVFTALPGAEVTLDGGGEAGDLITLEQGAAYVDLRGLRLEGFRGWGITVEGDNHHIRLQGLTVSGGEAGVHFTVGDSGEDPIYGPVRDITLADSTISGAEYTAVDCTPGPCDAMTFTNLEIGGAGRRGESSFAADGLAVERGQGIVVSGCRVHDNGGDGIDLNSRDTAGYVQGVRVEANRVYDNLLQAIKLWAGGEMINNAVWGNGINPVMIGVYPGDYLVAHNTIAYNMWDPATSSRDYAFVAAYPETGASVAITLTLLNNIFAFNTGPQVGEGTGLYLGDGVTMAAMGGNLFYSRADGEVQIDRAGAETWLTRDDLAGWGLGADPLFVTGWPEVDLHLQAGSPAIDAGVVAGVAVDIDGRPRGDSPDSGAFEF